jgi:hypothetical protein
MIPALTKVDWMVWSVRRVDTTARPCSTRPSATASPSVDNSSPKEASESHRTRVWGLERQSSVRLHAPHDLPDESPKGLGTLDADSDDRIRRHPAFVHAGGQIRHQ